MQQKERRNGKQSSMRILVQTLKTPNDLICRRRAPEGIYGIANAGVQVTLLFSPLNCSTSRLSRSGVEDERYNQAVQSDDLRKDQHEYHRYEDP